MKQDITVSLDSTTLQRAKQLAGRRNLSVSELLAASLAEQVEADLRYDQARRQAMVWLKTGEFDLGGDYPSWEAVHER